MERNEIELIRKFKDDLIRRDLSRDTIIQYPYYVKEFYKMIGNLLEIDKDDLEKLLDYLQSKNLKKSSISKYFNALSTFYEFLVWENYVSVNPVKPFRTHYLKSFKNHDISQRRKNITLEQVRNFVQSILDPQALALIVVLFKTGLRRKECAELDVSSVDLENKLIHIKPTGKRSNETVLFDDEAKYVLEEWLRRRPKFAKKGCQALFLDKYGHRLGMNSFDRLFKKYAVAAGLHTGDAIDQSYTPHNCRHWFTTQLLERGMPREYVMELRGDSRSAAIDIYHHIDPKKLKQSYLDCIPQFGLR